MKKLTYRDGSLRDGAPTRVEYDIAEMSDIPAVPIEPWVNTNGSPADNTSVNIRYTSGNISVGAYGSSVGVESAFQSASSVAGEGHLQTSWVYAHALEAPTEKGTASTAVIVGQEDNFHSTTDQVSVVTSGLRRVTVNADGQAQFVRYGGAAFNDNAAVKILGVQSDGDVVQVDPDSLAGDFTVIDNIDLKSTGTPNQFTVEVSWTDADGTSHTTTDPTPIDIVDSQSPWDNPDNTPADQASSDIQYTAGNVGIGRTPNYGLHVDGTDIYAKEFIASGGTESAYLQRSNDGTGNFHEYWNTEGGTVPVRLSNGYVLNHEFTANSEWYQISGAGNDVIGSPISWVNIHYYNMSTGQHWFPEYGDGDFENNNPSYLLGVTGNGLIVEVDPDTLGGGVDTDDQTLTKIQVSPNTVRVSISDGNSVEITITPTTTPMYEHRDIWAEESSGINSGSAEWSFGNSATGYIGLPIDAGWEVEAMYFHADTYPSAGRVQVDLMNYGNTPSNAAANTISSITLSSATDGGGQTNNAYKYEILPVPITIPVTGNTTVIGFITRSVTGNITDARVGARLRRKVGDYVSSVSLT